MLWEDSAVNPEPSVRVEPISQATSGGALRFLSRAPYCNVFLTHFVLHGSPAATRRNVVVVLEGGAVRGVAYFGRQIAIAADAEAVEPLAQYARRRRGERMIVGPRETVVAFWERIRRWHESPRLVRERQLVMMVDRKHLQSPRDGVTVRQAKPDDWRAVAEGSAQMIRHELGYDPRATSPDFSAGVREMIERNLWWIGLQNGDPCFLCNVGPWSDRTLQLQGIWTPPAMRGRGLATASLIAICDRLLDVSPTLSLYVNDFNAAAIALYERVGFEHVADFQTILF
jgi:uncharacterized protein